MLVFMFSLVTMEKIRIDGFHGDYLKIRVSLKVWTLLQGSQNACGAPGGFLYGIAKGWSEHSWIQTDLPLGFVSARILVGFFLGSHSPGLSSTAHSSHLGTLLFIK